MVFPKKLNFSRIITSFFTIFCLFFNVCFAETADYSKNLTPDLLAPTASLNNEVIQRVFLEMFHRQNKQELNTYLQIFQYTRKSSDFRRKLEGLFVNLREISRLFEILNQNSGGFRAILSQDEERQLSNLAETPIEQIKVKETQLFADIDNLLNIALEKIKSRQSSVSKLKELRDVKHLNQRLVSKINGSREIIDSLVSKNLQSESRYGSENINADEVRYGPALSEERLWLKHIIKNADEAFLPDLIQQAHSQGYLTDKATEVLLYSVKTGYISNKQLAKGLGIESYRISAILSGYTTAYKSNNGVYSKLFSFIRSKRTKDFRKLNTEIRQRFEQYIRKNTLKFLMLSSSRFTKKITDEILDNWPQKTHFSRERKRKITYLLNNPNSTHKQRSEAWQVDEKNVNRIINTLEKEFNEVAKKTGKLDILVNYFFRKNLDDVLMHLCGEISDLESQIMPLVDGLKKEDMPLEKLPFNEKKELIRLRLFKNKGYKYLSNKANVPITTVQSFFKGNIPLYRQGKGYNQRRKGGIEKFKLWLEKYFSEHLVGFLYVPESDDNVTRQERLKNINNIFSNLRDKYGLELVEAEQKIAIEELRLLMRGKSTKDIYRLLSLGNGLTVEVFGRHLPELAGPSQRLAKNKAMLSKNPATADKLFISVRVFKDKKPIGYLVCYPDKEKKTIFEESAKVAEEMPAFYYKLREKISIISGLSPIQRYFASARTEYLFYYLGIYKYYQNFIRLDSNRLKIFGETLNQLHKLSSLKAKKLNPGRLKTILSGAGYDVWGMSGAYNLYSYYKNKHGVGINSVYQESFQKTKKPRQSFEDTFTYLMEKDRKCPYLTLINLEKVLLYSGNGLVGISSAKKLYEHFANKFGVDIDREVFSDLINGNTLLNSFINVCDKLKTIDPIDNNLSPATLEKVIYYYNSVDTRGIGGAYKLTVSYSDNIPELFEKFQVESKDILTAFGDTFEFLKAKNPRCKYLTPANLEKILTFSGYSVRQLGEAYKLFSYFNKKYKKDILEIFETNLNGYGTVLESFIFTLSELKEIDAVAKCLTPTNLRHILEYSGYEARYCDTQYKLYRHWYSLGVDIAAEFDALSMVNNNQEAIVKKISKALMGKLSRHTYPNKNFSLVLSNYVRSILRGLGKIENGKNRTEYLLGQDEKGIPLVEKIFGEEDKGYELVTTAIDLKLFFDALADLERQLLKGIINGFNLDEIRNELGITENVAAEIYQSLYEKAVAFFQVEQSFDGQMMFSQASGLDAPVYKIDSRGMSINQQLLINQAI